MRWNRFPFIRKVFREWFFCDSHVSQLTVTMKSVHVALAANVRSAWFHRFHRRTLGKKMPSNELKMFVICQWMRAMISVFIYFVASIVYELSNGWRHLRRQSCCVSRSFSAFQRNYISIETNRNSMSWLFEVTTSGQKQPKKKKNQFSLSVTIKHFENFNWGRRQRKEEIEFERTRARQSNANCFFFLF